MFELVRKNRNRSIWLVIFMMILLAAIGFAAGEVLEPGAGVVGLPIAVMIGVGMFFFSFYGGSSALLMAAGAKEIQKADAPQLYNVVEEMVIASGLGKMPKVYVIESNVANAFASGRNPDVAAIAVTEGLLGMLSRDELQAVIAHEIAHVQNRDILFMTLLAVMAGAIALISHVLTRHLFWFGGGRRRSRSSSDGGGGQAQLVLMLVGVLLIVVGAIVARIIYFAASRTREYMADAGSAIYTRNPEALASALMKISGSVAGNKLPLPKVAHGLLIVGAGLFATHPPIEKRVGVLRKLAGAGELSFGEYARSFRQVTGKSAKFVPASAISQKAVKPAKGAAQNKGKEFIKGVLTTAGAAAGAGAAGAATTGATGAMGAGVAAGVATRTAFRREALDAIKKASGYEIVTCVCGGKIKIPGAYPKEKRNKIRCLKCGRHLEKQ